MRRLVRLVARLYPVWWRRRYASEFDALLDDLRPGWRDVLDVTRGAITMQVRTLGVPVVLALTGAIAGGLVAMQTPSVYAASATISVPIKDSSGKDALLPQKLRATLDTGVDVICDVKAATSVTFVEANKSHTIVKLTYQNRDPIQARLCAEKLTALVVKGSGTAETPADVINPPAAPVSKDGVSSPTAIASGAALGLLAGGLLILLRTRR